MYYILQWTWGIIQNVVGFILFLANYRRLHFRYNGAVVTVWKSKRGSMGLGMFIFLSESAMNENREFTLMHEYGHTVQSCILGPLFLPVIGLPSLLWAGLPVLRRYRERKSVAYYRLYTERWANFLGERFAAKNPEFPIDKS
ncbi:MAG: hypothetical protein HDT43_02195 [Ruminococcaceae bacterium]|nr:hypothetical protein [Oscillospiraceae bacterium]